MIARRALLAAGHVEAPEDEAELHVINTCCITSEAEAKSRQSVRRSLRSAGEVLVSGCAANLDAAQFQAIDERVRTFVGSAEDVAEQMAAGLGACADLDHDVLARDPLPVARASAAPRPEPGPDPRVHQDPGRLRLPLRLLHHPHGPRRGALAAGIGGARRGAPAGRAGPARDGHDRHQRRRLPRPRARARARRADGRGGAGARRRAGAALERRGDPRQGLAARGARDRAEGVPAPPRPDAVGRRRGAAGDGPPLRRRRVPRDRRALCAEPCRTSTSRPT